MPIDWQPRDRGTAAHKEHGGDAHTKAERESPRNDECISACHVPCSDSLYTFCSKYLRMLIRLMDLSISELVVFVNFI